MTVIIELCDSKVNRTVQACELTTRSVTTRWESYVGAG